MQGSSGEKPIRRDADRRGQSEAERLAALLRLHTGWNDIEALDTAFRILERLFRERLFRADGSGHWRVMRWTVQGKPPQAFYAVTREGGVAEVFRSADKTVVEGVATALNAFEERPRAS